MKKTDTGKSRRPINVKLLITQLSLGIAVVCLAVLLILWDAGILIIPGLTPPARRRLKPEGEQAQTREEPVLVDWAAWAEDQINALYDVSQLENPLSLLTAAPYSCGQTSLVRLFCAETGSLSVYGGLILAEEDGVIRYYLPETADQGVNTQAPEGGFPVLQTKAMSAVGSSENYRLTRRLTPAGDVIFENTDGSGYTVFDRVTAIFRPYTPPLAWELTDWETVPDDSGDGSGLTLICENGLYGYTGSYSDGKREVPVSVPCVYPVAFPYAEGMAVMADGNGRITVRNARGEEVLTDRSLLLMDNWREEETLGAFSNGLLRAVSAVYKEDGSLLSRNDEIVTATGKSFALPVGYRAVAYREGIFTVTNGESYGYYSAAGAWVGTPSYSYCAPFREGIATVTGEKGKEGLLSREGAILLAPAFTEIGAFSGGIAVLRDDAVGLGQVLLWKVKGQYPPPGEESPDLTDRSYYERVPLSRGPKNTFDDGDDIIIVLPELDLPPWVTTKPPVTTQPVYTVPVITDNPATSTVPEPQTTAPGTTDPVPTEAPPTSSSNDLPPETSGSEPEGQG